MTITITVFERDPDRGRGLARDMPVRWRSKKWPNPTMFAWCRSSR